jgi:predicted transcriptional regulator
MAKKRIMAAPARAANRSPAGWRKVTLDLPKAIAKRLHQLAIERDTTMGRLAAPAIQSLLAGSCFVDKSRELAIAPETAGAGQGELEKAG